jgi:hypothetical protein
MMLYKRDWASSKMSATLACALLVAPLLVGCSGGQSGANAPPIDESGARTQQYNPVPVQQPKQGMSTGTKVALLVGAAALYYMYKKNQAKRAAGDASQPQYYLSKNGRIYYRDQSGRAHWVTPPQDGIQVPLSEAQPYRDFQGYNNQSSGRTIQDIYASTGGQ